MNLKHIAMAVVASAAFGITSSAQAQTILSYEHVDIGIGYAGGTWDLHAHEEGVAEYEPDEVLLYVGGEAQVTRPVGSQWDFLGIGAGGDVWILPQTQNTDLLFLGIGTEEIDFDIFDNDQVTLTLVDVEGPGEFSLYTTNAFGAPTVRMSSANGIGSEDGLTLPVGLHGHFNWAFTETGMYGVSFKASGFIGGVYTESEVARYQFGVEAVPEPASVAALSLGIGALIARRRRARS